MRKTSESAIPSIGVAYLARGADADWRGKLERFARSYARCGSGLEHSLYIIFKAFANVADLVWARKVFSEIAHSPIFLDDAGFDIGAYAKWAHLISDSYVCMLNSSTELLAQNWLRKLNANLMLKNVGLVGATASYESLRGFDTAFPRFPNPHLRTNAIMIHRETFCDIVQNIQIRTKKDAYFFESGRQNLTRQILASGKRVLLVGRNGRGYSPSFWPSSETFRLGCQGNVLIGDNHTRLFEDMTPSQKAELTMRTWGQY